ncbi:FliH/SctL family protein [Piscinibacter terrae]|uniref:Flagellar assembly protein FliH/Type III secretion system HrpE domain-containing protein n=1 Tax=Piscinibacter terrae TaxID=2496871 RepID=A0A3N7HIK9_9BURK|nr:FliH/SctL family protein [Albitalea terrae]RQP21323.1 hypothetical protein DZC73_27885 [Albitalea terrae]
MDLVVLIDRPDLTVAHPGRLLKRADANLVTQADELLGRLGARERQMQAQWQQAYETHKQRGLVAGEAQARQEWAERLAAAHAARHIALTDLAPTLVDIVSDAVGLVLRRTDRRQLIASALEAVDDMLRQARWAKLRLHPSQLAAARRALDDVARHVGSGRELVTLVGDALLGEDDCIFETDVGIADASLGVQLAAIRSAVESAVAHLSAQRAAGQALSQEGL